MVIAFMKPTRAVFDPSYLRAEERGLSQSYALLGCGFVREDVQGPVSDNDISHAERQA